MENKEYFPHGASICEARSAAADCSKLTHILGSSHAQKREKQINRNFEYRAGDCFATLAVAPFSDWNTSITLPTKQDSARHAVPKQPQPVTVTLWGSGSPYSEFLHVDDMANAGMHFLEYVEAENLNDELQQTHINIGTGVDLTIKELAEIAWGVESHFYSTALKKWWGLWVC